MNGAEVGNRASAERASAGVVAVVTAAIAFGV